MLWHKWLGHPSFHYLKSLHSHLFINSRSISFQRDHCILAKQSRNSYPIQTKQTFSQRHLEASSNSF